MLRSVQISSLLRLHFHPIFTQIQYLKIDSRAGILVETFDDGGQARVRIRGFDKARGPRLTGS